MRIAVGYQKTVDDIEIGNSSAIGSPMNSRRKSPFFLSHRSLDSFFFLLLISTTILLYAISLLARRLILVAQSASA